MYMYIISTFCITLEFSHNFFIVFQMTYHVNYIYTCIKKLSKVEKKSSQDKVIKQPFKNAKLRGLDNIGHF